eukprot:symbB.v1.2.034556.t1/scaffold4484.1/size39132/3
MPAWVPTAGFPDGLLWPGVPEAIATTPFQVVKIRMQNKDLVKHYTNDIDCLVKVLSEEGALALFNGLQTTVVRNSIWNGVYFATIAAVSDRNPANSAGIAEQLQRLATGLGAGIFATCFNAPFDEKPHSAIQEWSDKQDHFQRPWALYKGFTPKAWRMGVGGAVSFATFDFAHGALKALG